MIVITIPSEQQWAEKLGYRTLLNEEDIEPDCDPNEIVVRWGAGHHYEPFRRVVNLGPSISKNVNKIKALQILSTVVKTPKLFTDSIPTGITAVVRPINHAGGVDFAVKTGPYVIKRGYHATEVIDTDKELRVWYAFGKCFGCIRVDLEHKPQLYPFPCRSEWGYRYVGLSDKLQKQVRKAFSALDLNLGAADILKKDNDYYFLELNTAPNLDAPSVLAFFKNALENVRQTGIIPPTQVEV